MVSHRQLLHAISLFEQGNFTRAAIESNISQSAFSRSIQNLESELGVSLFDRHKNSVRPTPYGELFLHRARLIIADTQEMERDLHLMRGLEIGTFSVAMGVYPADISGNYALGSMLNEYPSLKYRAIVGNWETVDQHVSDRTVDLGFVVIDPGQYPEHLEIEPVLGHEMAIYCRKDHPLARCKGLGREELAHYPLVSIRVPAGLADAIPGDAAVDAVRGHLVPSVEIDDFLTARTAIRMSDAIGITIPVQIEDQLRSGEFVLLDYPRPWIAPVYGFVTLKGRTISPAAEVFREKVIAHEWEVDKRNRTILDRYLSQARTAAS